MLFYLSIYLSIYLSAYLSICLSIYLPIYLSIYGFTVVLLDLSRFFSFLILYTVSRTPWMSDQPVARPPPTYTTTQTQNKRTHRHSFLECDSNPRSQLSREGRWFFGSCLRPRGRCDRLEIILLMINGRQSQYM
jgi:hypothetical protein